MKRGKAPSQKTLHIVGGPNGSGKSTFAESYFKKKTEFFINPDIIASGISPQHAASATIHAARIMISAVGDKIRAGDSFAFETTFSGKTWLAHLKRAKAAGYRITLYFIYLDRVSKNLSRIKKRVSEGGHPVPAADVRRRFARAFDNFWKLYRPLAEEWFIFDNSGTHPKLELSNKRFAKLSDLEQAKHLKRLSALFGFAS